MLTKIMKLKTIITNQTQCDEQYYQQIIILITSFVFHHNKKILKSLKKSDL